MANVFEDADGRIACLYPGCYVTMPRASYQMHLFHCRKAYKGEYGFCRFSPRHLLPLPELALHEKSCTKKESFARMQRALKPASSRLRHVSNGLRRVCTEPADLNSDMEVIKEPRKLSVTDSAIEDLSVSVSRSASTLSEDYFPPPTYPSKQRNTHRKTEQSLGLGKPSATTMQNGRCGTINVQPTNAVVRQGRGRGRRLRVEKDILRPGGGIFDSIQ